MSTTENEIKVVKTETKKDNDFFFSMEAFQSHDFLDFHHIKYKVHPGTP